MSATNLQRITIVLKPRAGEDIGAILPFLALGATVQIGRSGAVVSSLSEGDQIEEAHLLQNQVVIAESAMRRGLELPAFNIDHHARMALDAERYCWLRDKSRISDMDTDLCAAREEQCFFGTELDTEIDNGMRLTRLLETRGESV